MKRAVILVSLDGYANRVKPKQIELFLHKHGYSVTLFDTTALSRLSTSGVGRRLPHPSPSRFAVFVLGAFYQVLNRLPFQAAKNCVPYVMSALLRLRGKALSRMLSGKSYDLLICENNFDEGIFIYPRVAKIQVLDLPAPFAEELYYGLHFSTAGLHHLQSLEKAIYAKADHLSFHWHTYVEFVKQTKYQGSNFIDCSYGTTPKNKKAHFSKSPRIIFLGYLQGYWVNLPLLSDLCRRYPNIDVYGGPEPPAEFKINYKGYAPTTEILAEYQFGLITISDDLLRQHSFSSKHLEYISYGLPVFTPAWRKDIILDDSSIYFDSPADFAEQLAHFSNQESWELKSEQALATAQRLTWERALQNIASII
jgi:hypothetical protein